MALHRSGSVIADVRSLIVYWLKAGLALAMLVGPPIVLALIVFLIAQSLQLGQGVENWLTFLAFVGGIAGVIALLWRAGRITFGG